MISPTNTVFTSEELDRFHGSLDRCTAGRAFLERFYQRFLDASPLVREKFANTNWLRQYRMMVASFHLMSLAAEYDTDGDSHLARIAKVHGKARHQVPPELYDVWLDSLIEAVAESDPEFDQGIEDVWRRVMQRGIDFMRRHADD